MTNKKQIKRRPNKRIVPSETLEAIRAELAKESNKHGAGRPTDYREEYCQMIIDHLASGYSIESFAGVVGCCRDTIYEWRDKHPKFSDSIKAGLEKGLFFWEKIGVGGTVGKIKGFNAASFIFTMKNKFKWTDRTETNINGNLNVAPTVIFGIDSDDDAKD